MPALSWHARIIAIKRVPADSFVGYKRTFKTARATIIGILAVGYFDGYDFRLSNSGSAYVNNQYAPIIGRICMNFCMIDLTDSGELPLGTPVTLLGANTLITPSAIAHLIKQKNIRIFLTALAAHLPRIYR